MTHKCVNAPPQVTVWHQNGTTCCNNEHGYVEILSECSCNGDKPHMPLCGGFACGGQSAVSARSSSFARHVPLVPSQRAPHTQDVGGMVYATVFVSPTSDGNVSDCTLNAVSDMAVIVPLPSTAGLCQPLPAEVISALFGAAASGQNLTMTYALTMFDNQSISLQLMCYDPLCSQVMVTPHSRIHSCTHTHTCICTHTSSHHEYQHTFLCSFPSRSCFHFLSLSLSFFFFFFVCVCECVCYRV